MTFNYLCENLPNSLRHFWNHKSFFATKLVCIILAQTLDTSDKNIPSKDKFSDFSLLGLKFLMSFFKQKVSLSFGSLLSVMRENSSAVFYLKLYMIRTKRTHQCTKFYTFDCSSKILPNVYFDSLKSYTNLAIKYRGVMSHDPED